MTKYPNILAALDGSIWYIEQTKAEVLASVFSDILNGKIEAGGLSLGSSGDIVEKVGDVAVVKLHGVMGKHMTNALSGGVSTDAFRNKIEQLKNDTEVKAVVLDINSPGGSVHGVEQAASAVKALREVKPVYAVANDVIASAGYYIASAASKIMVQPTSMVGSIGTMATAVSASRKLDKEGIDVEIIRSGSAKNLNAVSEPIDNGRIEQLQEQVDYFGRMFQNAVRTNRPNLTQEQMDKIFEAGMFTAEAAIDAGLADSIASLDDVIAKAGEDANAVEQLEILAGEYATAVEAIKSQQEAMQALAEENELLQKKVDVLSADLSRNETEAIVDEAIEAKKIRAEKREHFIDLGMTLGVDQLNSIFAAIDPAPKVPLGPDAKLQHQHNEEEVISQYEQEAFAAFPSLNRN